MSLLWLTVFSLFQCSVGLPLSDFYPYGSEAGDAELAPNDDGSSPAISLSSPFPFFDSLQETVYVSRLLQIHVHVPVATSCQRPHYKDTLNLALGLVTNIFWSSVAVLAKLLMTHILSSVIFVCCTFSLFVTSSFKQRPPNSND